MVKYRKNYKIRTLRMPPKSPQNPRIWNLAKFHPEFIMVIFLMLMHDRFFAQLGGRHFRPTISVSPIVPQLLTIMSDTQAFPFFSRGHLLRMLACHGTALHLVRALCGPQAIINRKIMRLILGLILGRVVSGIAFNPLVVSCFDMCSTALLTYPVCVPRSPLYVDLFTGVTFASMWNYQMTIWQLLSLCTIFPRAEAILDISSDDLSSSAKGTYVNMCMIIIFRHLFEVQNRVFILFCKYFHSCMKYKEQKRNSVSFSILRKKIEKQLRIQMGSHDFEVWCYYLQYLSAIVLHPCLHEQSFLDDSLMIVQKFFYVMNRQDYRVEDEVFGRPYEFFGFSSLFKETDRNKIIELLDANLPQKRCTMCFCLIPPDHSSHHALFYLLQKANSLTISVDFVDYLRLRIREMECGDSLKENKCMNRMLRLMIIIITFAKWSQSDHPHRSFIFDCVASIKETVKPNKHLQRLLDLGIFQFNRRSKPSELSDFFNLFQKFADPSMGCSEPTVKTLLSLFNKMHMVFLNERFFKIIQEFLKTLEFMDWSILEQRCGLFLDELVRNDEFCSMLKGICYFRRTNCVDCNNFLDCNNDTGLCDNCKHQREQSSESEYSSEEDFYGESPRS